MTAFMIIGIFLVAMLFIAYLRSGYKTKYYARMGTYLETYFCKAPWKEIGATRYWFERIIMSNQCLKKETVYAKNTK